MPAGSFAVQTTSASIAVPIPFGAVVNNLQVRLSSFPGLGTPAKSYAFTVLRNGSATSLACTVSGGVATSCSGTDTTVWTAGDTIALQSTPSNNPTSRTVTWSVTIG